MDFVMGLVDRIVVMDVRLEAGRRLAGGRPRRRRACRRPIWAASHDCASSRSADLHVAYGKVEAVRAVSLEMDAGQIVTVIGPERRRQDHAASRGDGTAAVARQHHVRRRRTSAGSASRSAWTRGICLVPERRELFGDMTVGDNLLLGAYPAPARPRARSTRDSRRGLRPVSAPGRAPRAARQHAVGRRAADAGARARADGASRGC